MSDDIYWDDLIGWTVRTLLWGATISMAAWLLVAWGEARMSAVALRAFGDAEWCMAAIRPVLDGAERALDETQRANAVVQAMRAVVSVEAILP